MWSPLKMLCICTICFSPMVYSSVKDGFVTTPWGKIRGVPKTMPSGLSLTSFEGIPYAKPPLDNLRFSKPVPSKGSHQTYLMADAVKPSCLVANLSRESEDCLFLDLYVPHSNSTESSPLPVMVFIHGGGFLMYTGDVFPERLLRKNVIVALVHYRLGAMGFLSTGDDVLKGNYGLWDQRMAIQWVKDNVAAFGGNPNSITVFGESAGSASVAYQLLAPNSNDLFQRAILESGSATSPWAFSRQPAKYAHELGNRLGCTNGSSSADLAKCLRAIDGVILQKEVWAFWNSLPTFEHLVNFVFVPVVDHEFVLDEPWNLIKNHSHLQSIGAFDKDVVIGVLNNESFTVTYSPSLPNPPYFGDYFIKTIIPDMLRQRYGVSTTKAVEAVDSFYRKNIPKTSVDKNMVAPAFEDHFFLVPGLDVVDVLSKSKASPGRQYFYYFDYCPSFAPVECMGHGTDLVFLFESPYIHYNFSPEDQHIAEVFVSFLTSFATNGTPEALNTPKWTPFTPETKAYMQISKVSEAKQNLFPSRVEFWANTIPPLINGTDVKDPVIG